MKIIFFGSSEFSVPALKACLDRGYEISLVISTPDRKKGRGMKLQPTAVKAYAEERQLKVVTPENLKDEGLLRETAGLAPDLFVVSSFGYFIPSKWLNIPSLYALNVHPSLLPKYRGAAPLNWTVINGDDKTGISIMEVTKELDAGDVFYQKIVPLPEHLDAEQLSVALADLSHGCLMKVFDLLDSGKPLARTAQDSAQSCYARKLTKGDGLICWTDSARRIHNAIRGYLPWPTARIPFEGGWLQILKSAMGSAEAAGKPGELLQMNVDGSVQVQTGEGVLMLAEVKASGKKQMKAADFIHGKRLKPGFIFESAPGEKPQP